MAVETLSPASAPVPDPSSPPRVSWHRPRSRVDWRRRRGTGGGPNPHRKARQNARRSALDERLQPRQRLIPLLGHQIQVFAQILQRPRIELESTFPTAATAVHDACALEHSKMLGDRLAAKRRVLCELGKRTRAY